MKTAKILGIFIFSALLFAGASSAMAASSTIGAAFSGTSYGGYPSDNWLSNLVVHSKYPYDNTNYFGSPYNPYYNSYPSVNDSYYFDEDPNFVPNVFGAMSASNRYSNYNNWDVVDSYYGSNYGHGYNDYSYGYGYDSYNYDPYYSYGYNDYYSYDDYYDYSNYNYGYSGYVSPYALY